MADMSSLYGQNKPLSEEQQKQIGKSPAGAMGNLHTSFVKTVAELIQSGSINVYDTATFYNPGAYEALSEETRGQVDLAVINIANLLHHIADYYLSKETPNASPQLQQMIEELWQMKDRLEGKYGDILKF